MTKRLAISSWILNVSVMSAGRLSPSSSTGSAFFGRFVGVGLSATALLGVSTRRGTSGSDGACSGSLDGGAISAAGTVSTRCTGLADAAGSGAWPADALPTKAFSSGLSSAVFRSRLITTNGFLCGFGAAFIWDK